MNIYTSVHNLIDYVADQLKIQNVKSCYSEDNYLDRSYCMYRDPRGNKCAIGHLIPNSKYRTSMENLSSDMLFQKYNDLLLSIKNRYKISDAINLIELLERLQDIHDLYNPSEWDIKFKELKNEFKIS